MSIGDFRFPIFDGYGFSGFTRRLYPEELKEERCRNMLGDEDGFPVRMSEVEFNDWTPFMVYEFLKEIFEEKHMAKCENNFYNIEVENKELYDCFFCGEKLKTLKVCVECDKKGK